MEYCLFSLVVQPSGRFFDLVLTFLCVYLVGVGCYENKVLLEHDQFFERIVWRGGPGPSSVHCFCPYFVHKLVLFFKFPAPKQR
jgi:hypothetical protein